MMTDLLHPSGIHIQAEGPWPFVTHRSYTLAGRRIVWLARQHRKGLDLATRAVDAAVPPFWQGRRYNWSIGAIFALGSFLFMLGSMMSLISAGPWQPSVACTNLVFFLGSIPFTTAAYLQHFQAANERDFTLDPDRPGRRRLSWIGWHPRSAGWFSTFAQLIGTIAFNMNTFNAMVAPSAWLIQDVAVWMPDLVGSVLFLLSGYLAFIEAGHRYWSWRPQPLSWQIAFVNLIGCVAFMVAAITAFVPGSPEAPWIVPTSMVQLLVGASCFFVGAVLTMRESSAGSARPSGV
ncbi:hypothetical protein GXW78_01390 [Roseomonas terrae]|jgi:hypothetical protein|uniref:YrhK domain-containing protein n=1 Tax=Neoroseomonas terrae TaxID=424799 RepID=A0ABS5EBB2_9PROT|nr:hypothetical protein [Neoroseomonas terrae]MBR0648303.1 hypothetical protein [Neoroseomonas terrae]